MTELPFHHEFKGKTFKIQILDKLPAAVRPMTDADVVDGKQVFYEIEIGPNKGKYCWDIITDSGHTHTALFRKITLGKAFVL